MHINIHTSFLIICIQNYILLKYISRYILFINKEVICMTTAKLFENGRSQAVRLPKEFRFNGDEVIINKIGNVVLLMPKDDEWAGFVAGLSLFTDDFMCNGREDIDHQERETL